MQILPLISRSGLIGLDLGPTHVRLIELESVCLGAAIKHQACVALADHTYQASAIRTCVHASGIRTRRAALAVPEEKLFRHSFTLPPDVSPEELELLVGYEAEERLGVSADSLYIDFRVLQADKVTNGDKSLELLAVNRDLVTQLETELKTAGLQLVRLEGAQEARERGNTSDTPQELVLAYGLALGATSNKGFNLLPWRKKLRRSLRNRLALSVLLVALGAGMGMYWWQQLLLGQLEHEEHRLDILRNEAQRIEQQIARGKIFNQQLEWLIMQWNAVRLVRAQSKQILMLIKRLAEIVPTGVCFERLGFSASVVSIEGEAWTDAQVIRLMQAIETTQFFSAPQSLRIENKRKQSSDARQNFQLSFSLAMQKLPGVDTHASP